MDSLDPPKAASPEASPRERSKPRGSRAAWAVVHAIGISLIAACAVQLGFGAAYVSAGVGWATTGYTAALVAVLAGREAPDRHFSQRWWVRVPVSLGVSAACLWFLRGAGLASLPFGSFTTTGHTPFVVFPVSAALSGGVLECLARVRPTHGSSSKAARSD